MIDIERAWRALEARVEHRSHVSTFDFLATWYRHYAGDYGGAPLIGLAWQDGELAGVAPLTVRRGKVGRIPVTRVDFAPTDSIAGEFLIEGRPARDGRRLHRRAGIEDGVKFDVICLNGFDPASGQLAVAPAGRHATSSRDADGGSRLRGRRSARRIRGVPCEPERALPRASCSQKAKKIAAAGISRLTASSCTRAPRRSSRTIARMIAINEASYKLDGPAAGRLPPRRSSPRWPGASTRAACSACRSCRLAAAMPPSSSASSSAGCFYDITLAYDETFAKAVPGSLPDAAGAAAARRGGSAYGRLSRRARLQEALVHGVRPAEARLPLRAEPPRGTANSRFGSASALRPSVAALRLPAT